MSRIVTLSANVTEDYAKASIKTVSGKCGKKEDNAAEIAIAIEQTGLHPCYRCLKVSLH